MSRSWLVQSGNLPIHCGMQQHYPFRSKLVEKGKTCLLDLCIQF